jgi:hypothetical protein
MQYVLWCMVRLHGNMSYYSGAVTGVDSGSIGEIASWRFIHRDQNVVMHVGDGLVPMIKELSYANADTNDLYAVKSIETYCTLTDFDTDTYSGVPDPENTILYKNRPLFISEEIVTELPKDKCAKGMTVVEKKENGRIYFRKYETLPQKFNYTKDDNADTKTLHVYVLEVESHVPMGWLGDPTAVKEKSNNRDNESFVLELTTETLPNTIAGGNMVHTFQPYHFFSMDVVRRLVHTAVSKNIEDMIRRYNNEQSTMFKTLREQDLARMQKVLEHALTTPLTTIHNPDGTIDTRGGYHLLQDARIAPRKRRIILTDKDQKSRTLYKLLRVNEDGSPVQASNNLVARTVKDLVTLPTIYEDAPADVNELFTDMSMPTETDLDNEENTMLMGRTPQTYMVQPYLKPKISLLDMSNETTNNIARTSQVGYHPNTPETDAPATQFEHDMALVTPNRLSEEIQIFVRLLVSCLTAKTTLKSPKEEQMGLQVTQAPHFPLSTTSVDNPTWGKSVASMFGGAYNDDAPQKLFNEQGDNTVIIAKQPSIRQDENITIYEGTTMSRNEYYNQFKRSEFNSVYYLYVEALKAWTAENQLPKTWKPPLFQNMDTQAPNDQVGNISLLAAMISKNTVYVKNVTRVDLNTIQFDIYFHRQTGPRDTDFTTYIDTKQITYAHNSDTIRSIHAKNTDPVLYIGVVRRQKDGIDTIQKIQDENGLEMSVWEITAKEQDADVVKVMEAYINAPQPCRADDDNEYTACSALLWEKCRQQQKVPNVADINALGVLLSTATPFGPITAKMQTFGDMIHHEFTKNPNLYDAAGQMRYLTLTAYEQTSGHLDIQPQDVPEIIFEIKPTENGGLKWALGCESNLLLEALHILLLYFNNMIKETLTTEENKLDAIQKRESVTGWDTYPCGLLSVVHTTREKTYFSTVNPADDITNGIVRPVEACKGTMVTGPKIHAKHNTLRNELYGTDFKSTMDDVSTFYKTYYPGTPHFIRPRSWIRKETQYMDSNFASTKLESAASRSVKDIGAALHFGQEKTPTMNRWSGLAMYTRATNNQYPQPSIYFLTVTDHARHKSHLIYDIQWNGAPIYNASGVHVHEAFSGLGAWNIPPTQTEFDLRHIKLQRYRGYTGAAPRKHDTITPEQQWAAKLVGPSFNDRVQTVRYTIPDITFYRDKAEHEDAAINRFTDMGKWLVDGFMGWHHTTVRALNRTVSAVVVHTEMRRLIRILNTPKPEDPSKPRAYSVLYSNSNHMDMAIFVLALYEGTQNKSVGFVKANPLVIPAICMVKGPTETSIPTKCSVSSYYETTGMYNIICNEAANKIRSYTPLSRSRIPRDAMETSLVCRLYNKHKIQKIHTLFDYVSFHPEAITYIVKLCSILHHLQGVKMESQKFRDNNSLMMCKYIVYIIYICTYTLWRRYLGTTKYINIVQTYII